MGRVGGLEDERLSEEKGLLDEGLLDSSGVGTKAPEHGVHEVETEPTAGITGDLPPNADLQEEGNEISLRQPGDPRLQLEGVHYLDLGFGKGVGIRVGGVAGIDRLALEVPHSRRPYVDQ